VLGNVFLKKEYLFNRTKSEQNGGEILSIQKSHRLKPMTTKKLYLGAHALQLQINGKKYDKVPFDLVE
jgi:hypothetical protein